MRSLASMIRPAPGRAVIHLDTKAEVTASGIIVERQTARTIHEQRPTIGKIIAIGKKDSEDSGMTVGEIVAFGRYSGVKITYQDPEDRNHREEVIVLNWEDILAVLEDETIAAATTVKA